MRRGFFRNLLAFLLVLVLTLAAVSILSAATRLGPDAAAQYSQAVRQEAPQVAELSAPAKAQGAASWLESIGGFLVIVVAAGAGGLSLLRGRRKRGAATGGQAYRPRKDMARTVRGRL